MKLKKLASLGLAALLAVITMSMAGCGGNDTDKLVVGLDDAFPPFGFRDESNNIVGFDIDLAKEVANRLGKEVEFVPITWNMKVQELNNHNVDCLWNGFTITEDLQKEILYSIPYVENNQVLVVRADSNYATRADLAGKKLTLQSGSSAEAALDNNAEFKNSLGEIITHENNLNCLMELDSGTCDVALMDETVASYQITQKDGAYKIIDESLAPEKYGIGFRKDDTELCEQVNETLRAMKEDGTLAKISNEWFGKDITVVE